MATQAEKLAAIQDALQNSGIVDHSEAERFLIMWEALLPFIPTSAPQPSPPSAVLLVDFAPTTEADKQQAEQIRQQTWDLIRKLAPPT